MQFPPIVDTAEAEQMLADGMSVRQIADRFDVSPQAVYELIRRGKIKRPAACNCD